MRRDGIMRIARIAAFAVLATVALPAVRDSAANERIAAIVNKEVILESDVDEQLRTAIGTLHADPSDSAAVAKLRKDVLQQLIDEQVILAEAQRQGITIAKADLDQAVKQAVENVRARLGTEQNFQRALTEERTTEIELRRKYEPEVKKQLLVMRLVGREVQSKTTVTDAEVMRVHKSAILIDSHNDVPSATVAGMDIGKPNPDHMTDLPRMKQGGMGAQFFAVYVAASYTEGNHSANRALAMIDTVRHDMTEWFVALGLLCGVLAGAAGLTLMQRIP